MLQPIYGRIKGEHASFPGCAVLHLDFAVRQALRPDDDLPRQADQIHSLEFRAGALACIVVENVVIFAAKRGVELRAGRVACAVARLQIDQADAERRDQLRPNDACHVVARFDDGRDEARNAHAVRSALQGDELAIGALNLALHLRGVFRAEVEDMPHLDAARGQLSFLRHLALEAVGVVHLARRRIIIRPALDHRARS